MCEQDAGAKAIHHLRKHFHNKTPPMPTRDIETEADITNLAAGFACAAYFDGDAAVEAEVALIGVFNLMDGVGLAQKKAFAEGADIGY